MSDWLTAIRDHEVYQNSFDPEFWRTLLRDRPDVLHHILADLHMVAGKGTSPSLDDLWELVAPKYSDKPFAEAFTEAMNGRSLRQIASSISLSHASLSRYLTGEKKVVNPLHPLDSMQRLELIAKGLGVRPAYFVEWRRLWVMNVIDSALGMHPNVSTSIYQRFAGQQKKGGIKGGRAQYVVYDEAANL